VGREEADDPVLASAHAKLAAGVITRSEYAHIADMSALRRVSQKERRTHKAQPAAGRGAGEERGGEGGRGGGRETGAAGSAVPCDAALFPFPPTVFSPGHVARFRQKFTLEDASGSHACSLEALTCV
jgi:PHD/YefM family antitoxin component YafN of YafNO toxin-antitoxin module